MELDELKAAWGELNNRVSADHSLLRGMWKEEKVGRTRGALAWVTLVNALELLPNVVAVLLTGSFLGDGPHEAKFLIPGLILHLVAIALIGVNVWQLTALGQVDYAEPIAAIQRKLAQIRTVRLRVDQAVLICAPLLWTPLAIVTARGLLGLDLYRAFGWPWVAANIAVGLIALPILLYLARRFDTLLGPFWDGLAGRKLAAAQGFLDEIERFERE